mgnify:CR=1 FL=1
MKSYITIIIALFLFVSCANDNDCKSFDPQTETDILKYIKDKNLNAQKTNSGLYYVITKEGNGNKPASNTSNVTVAYKGYFLDGSILMKTQKGILLLLIE